MKKQLILLISCLILAASTQAQDVNPTPVDNTQTFTCLDGTTYRTDMQITHPTLQPTDNYSVTAFELTDDAIPIIQLFAPAIGMGICGNVNPIAASYDITLPTIEQAQGSQSANQNLVAGLNNEGGAVELNIGAVDTRGGEFLILIEGGQIMPDETDQFDLRVSPQMVASGVPLTVYAISVPSLFQQGTYNPALSVRNGAAELARCTGVVEETCVPLVDSSLTLLVDPIIPTPNDAAITIPLDGLADSTLSMNLEPNASTGGYLLALHYGVAGESETDAATPAAILAEEDGSVTLACDGETVTDRGIALRIADLPDDATYDVLALAQSQNDPIMAVVNGENTGNCIDNTEEASKVIVSVPYVTSIPSQNNASDTITVDERAIIGNRNEEGGGIVVLVTGLNTLDNAGILEIVPTAAMLEASSSVFVSMIALDSFADPFLELVDADGNVRLDMNENPIQCDDAGFELDCHVTGDSLDTALIRLPQGLDLRGTPIDATMQIPLDEASVGQPLRIRASDTGEFAEAIPRDEDGQVLGALGDNLGDYVLVIQLVTN